MWTPENIERLKETCKADLRAGMVQKDNWLKLRQAYIETIEVLKLLPSKVYHRALVPVSDLAFYEGLVERTNEVMVSLGAGCLVLCTTNDAIGIFERRMESIDKVLAEFDSQQVHNEKKIEILQQFLDEEPFLIYEPLVDDDKSTSRDKHKSGVIQQNEAGRNSVPSNPAKRDEKADDQSNAPPVTNGKKRVSWVLNADSKPEIDNEEATVSKPTGKAVQSILKKSNASENKEAFVDESVAASTATPTSRVITVDPVIRLEVIERSGSPKPIERTETKDAPKHLSKFRQERMAKKSNELEQVQTDIEKTD
ncbi:hypothetical protein M514_04659 [Trichuris suis]|uniref:Uncharacterized protein n=1 Tax=Trichuris suis TaxID=68888 RepID=A0A085NV78_9BILA|nr:hypothetical protein M513_04659 [Trichuris suis]KFD73374.1 hypothetical protein M514_04659 [Trichuris suis]KHJ45423.1 prefoldin subunit [Trichuris suis]